MGIVIFAMPKRDDFLGLSGELRLIGLSGFIHGINEWIELFVIRGSPFNVGMLKAINAILLPASFIFLILFGGIVISRRKPAFRYLRHVWAVSAALLALTYLLTKDPLITGIVSRYFMCLPGAIMSAIALYICYEKAITDNPPRTVMLGAAVAIGGLLSYGILSGLIVPGANFFPASVINYKSFTHYFGLPIQVFRMAVAAILAISFFSMTGLFYRAGRTAMFRGGVRRKISLAICSVSLFIIIVGIYAGYSTGYSILHDMVVRSHQEMASLAAIATTELLDKELGECQYEAIVDRGGRRGK